MWNSADAEKEFRRAIELDPNSVKAHHWYATFLHALNRHEEALMPTQTKAKKPQKNAISLS